MNPAPIDAYLDDLLGRLHGRAADIRRMLAESEDHLRAAAADGVANGCSPVEAERQAVERFGTTRAIARGFGPAWLGGLSAAAVRDILAALSVVGMIGFVGIGVSGILAAAFGSIWGKAFVSGDPNGVTYTPSRCGDYLSYFPKSGSCQAAAIDHHFEEIVSYRVAVGIVGVLGLAVLGVIRRHQRRRDNGGRRMVRLLPSVFRPTVGAALFAVAAILLGLDSANLLAQGADHGAGGQLSGAVASAALACIFSMRLLGTLAQSGETVAAP